MKSMTGFGSARLNENNIEIEIEIKSVNSRYLDLKTYLPRDLNFFESVIRAHIPQHLSRGSVELRLNVTDHRELSIKLDKLKLLKYKEIADAAADMIGDNNKVSIEYLLQEPGVLENTNNLKEDTVLAGMFIRTLDIALSKLIASQTIEAEQMKVVLKSSMDKISSSLSAVETLSSPFKQELYENMLTRVKELVGMYKLENLEQRIVQETAIYVDKYDIGEELSRLTGHIDTLIATLEKEGDCGKTLNFIIQEMQREANTLGSKFSTSKSFQHILVIKEEIEKCREIVQNVA